MCKGELITTLAVVVKIYLWGTVSYRVGNQFFFAEEMIPLTTGKAGKGGGVKHHVKVTPPF